MSYEFTKLSEVPAVSEFPEGANAIIETNGEIKRCPSSGGSSVPKPLTYDYMPAGYPSKSVQATTLMEEQAVDFSDDKGSIEYYGNLADPFEISEGQTYTVNWDGTAYVCVCVISNSRPVLGNLSVVGAGDDTGEPFFFDASGGMFITLNTSASHTISVKRTGETVTPMAEEFLPNIPADKLPTGANSTTVFYL